eukprot:347947-Chlamydomonas_euryale.AAC.9
MAAAPAEASEDGGGKQNANGQVTGGGTETLAVPAMPGRLADVYDVQKAVGKGGYAIVYKAVRREDRRVVAVKKVEVRATVGQRAQSARGAGRRGGKGEGEESAGSSERGRQDTHSALRRSRDSAPKRHSCSCRQTRRTSSSSLSRSLLCACAWPCMPACKPRNRYGRWRARLAIRLTCAQ